MIEWRWKATRTFLLLLTLATSAPAQLFLDRTAESGLDFTHFNGMTGEYYLLEVNGSGVGLLDYDNDGDLDAYLVQEHLIGPGKTMNDATFPPPETAPPGDRLFRNDTYVRPDGSLALRFTDVTESAGLEATGYGMGVAVGDFDNDGGRDIYVTNYGSNQLWRNNGDGTFDDVTAASGTDDTRWSVPATFLDYDADGWLDLFIANYVDFTFSRHRKCPLPTGAPDYCAPLAYSPEPDRLLRNRGDGTFEDTTFRSGIHAAYGNALGAVTADFNGDGRVDIYVANDMMPNQMWINNGDGTFTDEGMLGGSAVNEEGTSEASMGVIAGDIDADGDTDLFMTHLAGETNTLYINDGFGNFRDETRSRGLALGSWEFTAFGTALLDFDNDGWLDLAIANGAVTVLEALAREGDPYPLRQANQLYRGFEGHFEDVTAQAGSAFTTAEVSRGLALGDIDNDGDADLLLSNSAGPARILVNAVGNRSAWLAVRAIVAATGSDVLGTGVTVVRSGSLRQTLRVQVDGSFASASDPRVLFGLGEPGAIESLEITWPTGPRQRLLGTAPNRLLTVIRPSD